MSRNDHTEMGGAVKVFQTTRWTQLHQLQQVGAAEQRRITGELLNRYWKPVYFYLRRKGNNSEDAKDLTQGFFQEIVLGGQLLQKAQPQKGRFRNFLLTALRYYVNKKHQYEMARKRHPAEGFVPLDGFEEFNATDDLQHMSPIDAFNYTWASELVRMVYEEVADICANSDKQIHWEVFRRRVLDPILNGTPPPSLPPICEQLGIAQESDASNMIRTVKRIFRSTLNRHLRELVENESDVDDEFKELMQILSNR